MTTTTITRKIGQNRGKPRLWIEGAALENAGFPHGTEWTLVVDGDTLLIVKGTVAGIRTRKIAGKPGRPVVDIVGKALGPVAGCDSVTLTIKPGAGLIVVEGNRENLDLPLAA